METTSYRSGDAPMTMTVAGASVPSCAMGGVACVNLTGAWASPKGSILGKEVPSTG